MHEDKKIEMINIQYNLLTMHYQVSPLSYTGNTKTILPYTWSLLIHSVSLL